MRLSTKLRILRRCERHVGYYEAAWSPEYDGKKHMRIADKIQARIEKDFKKTLKFFRIQSDIHSSKESGPD